ncbi:hypothetical protein [Streptomyces sp. NPDC005805]|uniref:hypothetical protein n=1 Tax=Streptomyces sp. NPDC005805 TaxID=3157068 RepID=UPI003400E450
MAMNVPVSFDVSTRSDCTCGAGDSLSGHHPHRLDLLADESLDGFLDTLDRLQAEFERRLGGIEDTEVSGAAPESEETVPQWEPDAPLRAAAEEDRRWDLESIWADYDAGRGGRSVLNEM